MRFAEPAFLWALFALPLLALFLYWGFRRRKRLAASFAAPTMFARLAPRISFWGFLIRSTVLLLAFALLVLALARPQWGRKNETVERLGLDIVLAQDISASMLATDIAPSRLVRSRHEIAAFLDAEQGDRVGLVAFAGEAQEIVPLTLDYGAVRGALEGLSTGWLTPGTDIAAAIRAGTRMLLGSHDGGQKVLVLLTDGEEHQEAAIQAAGEAQSQGIRIYTIGIGSRAGVPIPEPNASGSVSYKKDREGNVVTTRLEEATLQKIASATGGKYFYAGPGDFQLQKVLTDIANLEKQKFAEEQSNLYQERYALFLALAVLLIVLEAL